MLTKITLLFFFVFFAAADSFLFGTSLSPINSIDSTAIIDPENSNSDEDGEEVATVTGDHNYAIALEECNNEENQDDDIGDKDYVPEVNSTSEEEFPECGDELGQNDNVSILFYLVAVLLYIKKLNNNAIIY